MSSIHARKKVQEPDVEMRPISPLKKKIEEPLKRREE